MLSFNLALENGLAELQLRESIRWDCSRMVEDLSVSRESGAHSTDSKRYYWPYLRVLGGRVCVRIALLPEDRSASHPMTPLSI